MRPGIPRALIGHKDRQEVRLTSMDWYQGGSPWNQGNIRRGRAKGTWAIEVVRAGRYRVELRRYPREADLAVGAVSASAIIGESKASSKLDTAAKTVVFTMKLTQGKHDFSGGFKDDKGRDIGAFFAYMKAIE